MDYTLAVTPDLGVDPAAFAEEWNQDAECRKLAAAKLEDGRAVAFPIGTTLVVVLSLAAWELSKELVVDSVKDLLKDKIKKVIKKVTGWSDDSVARVEVEQVESGANRLLVVRVNED